VSVSLLDASPNRFNSTAAWFSCRAAYVVPLLLTESPHTRDFNVRLNHPINAHTIQLCLLVGLHGLRLCADCLVRRIGGIIYAVITRVDADRPDCVTIIAIGLSDHHLSLWLVCTTRVASLAVIVRSRHQLDYVGIPNTTGDCPTVSARR
jgi:hypothetical protein